MSTLCINGHDEAYCPTWPWSCEEAVWIRAAIKFHDGQDGDR